MKNDDIMCLEYISDENQLLLGAESGNILTHDITNYIAFNEDNWLMLEDGEDSNEEDYYPMGNQVLVNAELEEIMRRQNDILANDKKQ